MSLDSSFNPYASPQTSSAIMEPAPSFESMPGVRRALAQTRPWLIALAVVAILVAALTAFGALAGFIVMFAGREPAVGILVAGVYLSLAACFFFPSLFLIGYFSRIGGYLQSDSLPSLEQAMKAQFRLWFCLGIIGIIWLVLVGGFCLLGLALSAAAVGARGF
ncbi:MAG: hypothetical protein HYS13_23085 [Planctomycetia bacterium]|nr:hypothetical protein [Planctomycetia bacterium]